jgi:CRISPR-associated protein Cas1
MSGRTVIVQNPAHLKTANERLVVCNENGESSIPLSDISCVLIEDHRVTFTTSFINRCAQNSLAVFTCDERHIPCGVFLPLNQHSIFSKRISSQIALPHSVAGVLWRKIIESKIENQALCLLFNNKLTEGKKILDYRSHVKNHDPDNIEGIAARIYFQSLFGDSFSRDIPCTVNAALNYGYALVRGLITRSLVSTGFQPVLGIHHSNQFNQFNLADDLIEPFRPLVDLTVCSIIDPSKTFSTQEKRAMLSVFAQRMGVNKKKYKLEDCIDLLCQNLCQCYELRNSKFTNIPKLLGYNI